MATSEEIKPRTRRKRTEVAVYYQSVDEALQAKHEQMVDHLKGGKLDQLKALRLTREK